MKTQTEIENKIKEYKDKIEKVDTGSRIDDLRERVNYEYYIMALKWVLEK